MLRSAANQVPEDRSVAARIHRDSRELEKPGLENRKLWERVPLCLPISTISIRSIVQSSSRNFELAAYEYSPQYRSVLRFEHSAEEFSRLKNISRTQTTTTHLILKFAIFYKIKIPFAGKNKSLNERVKRTAGERIKLSVQAFLFYFSALDRNYFYEARLTDSQGWSRREKGHENSLGEARELQERRAIAVQRAVVR